MKHAPLILVWMQCFLLPQFCYSETKTDPPPNIIVILSDDMGYSDLGCYGGEIRTPRLDQLAKNGLRFTQFYNTGRCCPTRASLLTGLYPHQASVGYMMKDNHLPGYRGDLGRDCVTIAEVLGDNGYQCYMSGKWHVTPHSLPGTSQHNWPLQRGFDRFYGTIHGAGSFYDPNSLVRDNTLISPFADPEYQPESYYYTDAISDHACRFITEHDTAEQPFFMYVAYTAAHWPMHAPEDEIAKYDGKYDGGYKPIRAARYERMQEIGLIDDSAELSSQVGNWNKVKNKAWETRCMETYAAMITRMDTGIGKIVDTLSDGGKLQNTLILFMQDNGGCAERLGRIPRKNVGAGPRIEPASLAPMSPSDLQLDMIPKQSRDGYPQRMGAGVMPGPADTFVAYGENWANVSNTPFRYFKHYVHEGGISTPLIAHWPQGVTGKNELRHTPTHLIDIMATCVDVADADYPEEFAGTQIQPPEGQSLRSVFNEDTLPERTIFFEHEGNAALRKGRWKLVGAKIIGPDSTRKDRWELYDMEADRSEMHDLSDTKPGLREEMIATYEAEARRTRVFPSFRKN
ncbi:arylsulfatase [Calycomorphotria hydatis]|uniref:Arylsulfatase n=1 Tax=Calycomorphotria hydatis TaxID=2528027 RepID=A0A517T396_9PLAN|nr:arylsulfatase [Calycomorphotria hydatis]QDT62852.1 Arylsulfatase [Calycomorphotria hydatis]